MQWQERDAIQGIRWTRSFGKGLTSADGQKARVFLIKKQTIFL